MLKSLKNYITLLLITMFASLSVSVFAAGGELALSTVEKDWLDAHPVIRLAPDPDAPPIEYFDNECQYCGIASDFLELVEQQLENKVWVPNRRLIAILLTTVAAFLVTAILVWNYLLKRRVLIRTSELRQARNELEILLGKKTEKLSEAAELLEDEQEERKRAESDLRESEYRYRIISEVISDFCYLLNMNKDGSYKREWLTESFARMTGYTSKGIDELGGWRKIVHPDDYNIVKEKINILLQGKEHECEYRIYKKNGEICWLKDFAHPEYDKKDGRVVRVFGAAQDITKHKKAEEERLQFNLQLQQTQKLESLGVLAGGIAHDFNNLLMGIMGNTDLALQDLPTDSPLRTDLKEVMNAATRAAELSRQMLAYSGKAQFVVTSLDLNVLVREMNHLLKTSISKNVLLKMNLAADLPVITADATQLRQIVMNLITNASDAIGDRTGVIALSTGLRECDREYLNSNILKEQVTPGDYVYLEVTDTGIGMDADTITRIFDPFYTTKFTGRGLGLASVLGIVRGHDGCIRVSSDPGKGSTFTILFPALEDAVAEKTEDSVTAEKELQSGTILLVDDEDTIRSLTKRMLKRMGFNVLTAADGREGVKIYRAQYNEIDCVLLDLTMPHMNGEEAFREMHNINKDVCVIIASGYAEEDIIKRFENQDIAGSIHKPYKMDTLKDKLRIVLSDSI